MTEPQSHPKTYFTVFAGLMVLTLVTVLLARLDLGPINTIVAIAIAFCKALLVVLYFMHLKYSTRLTWAVVLAGLYWLGILIALTLGDYLTRAW